MVTYSAWGPLWLVRIAFATKMLFSDYWQGHSVVVPFNLTSPGQLAHTLVDPSWNYAFEFALVVDIAGHLARCFRSSCSMLVASRTVSMPVVALHAHLIRLQ